MALGATLAVVWLATVSLVVINYFVPFNLVTLLYMLPVVVAATQWGLGPGILAAVAGAAAADFFFYPPLYTFWIRDPQNVVDLVLFLLIAVVTSNLAARLKNEAVALRRREKEISELGLATCLTGRDLIFAVQDYLSNTLRYQAVLIATDQEMHAHAAIPEDVRRQASKQAHCERSDRRIDGCRSAQRSRLAPAHYQSGDTRLWRHRRRSWRRSLRLHGSHGAARRNIARGSDADA
jgi:two-component system sensor histidine kinase KdpD